LEANEEIKRKVDLLAASLPEQLSGPWHMGHDRGRGNPHGWWSAPLEWPQPREVDKTRQDQCAYCCQEGHWRNECPQWPRDP
jgi:hypothetical protein